jgi:hypothetical protein
MTKSIEELLKLIEEKPKARKVKSDNKDVMDFISQMNIKSGSRVVPNYLIFYIYRCVWCPENAKRKAKKITFFQTFSKHFPDYRKNKQRYYMLESEIFEVNEEVLKAARQYDKQHWQSKKTQKKISVPE